MIKLVGGGVIDSVVLGCEHRLGLNGAVKINESLRLLACGNAKSLQFISCNEIMCMYVRRVVIVSFCCDNVFVTRGCYVLRRSSCDDVGWWWF